VAREAFSALSLSRGPRPLSVARHVSQTPIPDNLPRTRRIKPSRFRVGFQLYQCPVPSKAPGGRPGPCSAALAGPAIASFGRFRKHGKFCRPAPVAQWRRQQRWPQPTPRLFQRLKPVGAD
jgi:hypothetical protein